MHKSTVVRLAVPLATSLAGLLATAVLLLPPAAWGQDDVVTGAQLQELWAGKELVGNAANGSRIFMRFEKDGTASISVGNFSDTGQWRPHERGYCAKWAVIRKGDEACFSVVRSAGGYRILNPDGSFGGHISGVR